MQSLRDKLVDVISNFYVGDIVNALNDTGLDGIFFIDDGDLEYMRDESDRYTDVDFSEIDETNRFFSIDSSRGYRKAYSFDWLDDEDYDMLADYMLKNRETFGFYEVYDFFEAYGI